MSHTALSGIVMKIVTRLPLWYGQKRIASPSLCPVSLYLPQSESEESCSKLIRFLVFFMIV